MPGALTDDRLALDETSFDFRGLDMAVLEEHLDTINDVLDGIRKQDLTVRVHPWLWDSIECLDGCTFCDFVYQPGTSAISRDTLRLLGLRLDRCPTWDEEEPGFSDSLDAVEIAPTHSTDPVGEPVRLDPAFSAGIALFRTATRLMACLVFGACHRRGFWATPRPTAATRETYFFAKVQDLPDFWRSLYARERVAEPDFFNLADHAFPGLILHDSLSFRDFDGRYRDLRDRVATVLGALSDHFAASMTAQSGLPHQVQAELGRFGVDLSPESPNTRQSTQLMAMREVELDGRTFRCEWHAKLEPHRNRIHFSLPVPELGNRVIIGIFAQHLPT